MFGDWKLDTRLVALAQVSFDLTLPKTQLELGPLSWKGLKVSGFTGKVGVWPDGPPASVHPTARHP